MHRVTQLGLACALTAGATAFVMGCASGGEPEEEVPPFGDSGTGGTSGSGGSGGSGASRPEAGACVDRCSTGERQCVTGGYQECRHDEDDCLEWGPVVPCKTGEKCQDGRCEAGGCTDVCTEGSVRCNDDGTANQECQLNSGSGCWEWAPEVACNTGESCSGGTCAPVGECTDECAQGSRQCTGDAFQVCGNFDADTCTDWGTANPCNAGETCSDGYCGGTCTNECTTGSTQCAGNNGYQNCGDFDTDSCLEWGPLVPCKPGQSCTGGVCQATTSCQDECDTVGAKQCTQSGGGFQVCGEHDNDTCRDWGPTVTCEQNQTCEDGDCVERCGCNGHAGICEPNAPNSTTPCACDPDCGTPCGADSHCDSWCPTGVDPDCSCTCDYNEYCEAASNGSSDTCTCDSDCEPNEYACDDDGHCDTFCPAGVDPDCNADPCRERWMVVGWRDANQAMLSGSYTDPDPIEGAPWVLLSPNFSSGEAEIFVEFALEHASCVDQLKVDSFGYDDSTLGDGAEFYLYNWDTFRFDLMPDETIGGVADVYENVTTNPSPYLLCGTEKCFINAKIGASGWDNTHLWDIWVYAHMTP